MECKAITKLGTQCSRIAEPNSKYCWQHQNYETSATTHTEGKEFKPKESGPAELKHTNQYFQNKDLLQNTLLNYFSTDEDLKNVSKQFQNLNYEKYNTHIQPHGIVETYFPNSDIHETYMTYVNGKLNGLYQSWYINGQLWEEVNYRNGKYNGLYEEWFDNGNLFIQSHYKNGERDGLYEEWNYDGDLVKKADYVDGKLNGSYEEWWNNGNLSIRCSYIIGERDGLYQEWYNNGRPDRLGNYVNGKLNGLWMEWIEDNGQLFLVGNYKDGKTDGLFRQYDEDGNLEDEYFENGTFEKPKYER
jgi:antitoxin component YwqK of YwqJK toxin-antitoxin module